MQEETVGRRYARALAMTVEDDAVAAKIELELSALGTLLVEKGSDFRHAMLNPSFQPADRTDILIAIADANAFQASTRTMLKLLVAKDRLPFLPQIARAFRAEVDARLGRVRAEIVSAKDLDQAALSEIVEVLKARTGKSVIADVTVDADAISGVSARIGGLVFDGTLRAKFNRLKAELSAG